MNAEVLLKHFDRISEAPDAIPRLRQFILDMAVRGKLVEQDPNDEPAVALMEKVSLQRSLLEKQGTIKRLDAAITGGDIVPFPIPTNWLWRRFMEVAAIQSDLVDPKDYPDFPHIAPDNIESRTGRLLSFQTIRESRVFSSKHRFVSGCILYSKIRPALAKAAVVDFSGLCSADSPARLP